MITAEQLKQARYIRRGGSGPMPEGNCCGLPFPCNHVRVIEPKDAPSYYFCDRLQMRVSDYDSCKYYSGEEFMGFMTSFVETNQEIKKASGKNERKSIWKRLFGNK